jgi:hypothetical protein
MSNTANTNLRIFIIRYSSNFYVRSSKTPCDYRGVSYGSGISVTNDIERAHRFTMPEANEFLASDVVIANEAHLCAIEYAPLREGVVA